MGGTGAKAKAEAVAASLDGAADKLDELVEAAGADDADEALKVRKDRLEQLSGEARDVKHRVAQLADDLPD